MTTKHKAGIVPYVINEQGDVEMMFMVPSDPKYGGTRPQIAKGSVDKGETIIEAAIREGEEELGLKRSNFGYYPVSIGSFRTKDYTLHLFTVEVKSRSNFDQPHFETERTEWLTLEEFRTRGRESQLEFVDFLVSSLLD